MHVLITLNQLARHAKHGARHPHWGHGRLDLQGAPLLLARYLDNYKTLGVEC